MTSMTTTNGSTTRPNKVERQEWRQGYADPVVVPDARGWLEAMLGMLAGFEIVDRGWRRGRRQEVTTPSLAASSAATLSAMSIRIVAMPS